MMAAVIIGLNDGSSVTWLVNGSGNGSAHPPFSVLYFLYHITVSQETIQNW